MSRPLWILLVVTGYVVVLVVSHRLRLLKARKGGIPGARFAPFDHRTVLDELEELYRAGLPAGAGEGAVYTERPALPPVGVPVPWLRPDVWEGEGAEGEDPVTAKARTRMRGGHDGQVEALVDPTQDARVDQQLTSLGLHHFLRRLYGGDLDGAEGILGRLPAWTNGRISQRVVDKHLAQVSLLRAQLAKARGTAGVRAHASRARRLVGRAGATTSFADPGARALWVHVQLAYRLDVFNLDLLLFRADRLLRKALADHRTEPILYYELALACALRGKSEEAVDHLARALYYAGGDAFYLQAVLDIPEVARIKPALVKQARERFERG